MPATLLEMAIREGIETNEGEEITFTWHGGEPLLAGLSLDGPRDIHDAFRQYRGGRPTFDRVMRGLEILRKAGVEFNTLTTVNARSEGRGREVYDFLRATGSRFLQLLPVSEPGNPPFNVSGPANGRFLCDVFDQ